MASTSNEKDAPSPVDVESVPTAPESSPSITLSAKAGAAREAFQEGDAAKSKQVHDKSVAEEDHGGGTICGYAPGDYVSDVFFLGGKLHLAVESDA